MLKKLLVKMANVLAAIGLLALYLLIAVWVIQGATEAGIGREVPEGPEIPYSF